MTAGEVIFQKLLDGKVQYVVPLYQRTYRWNEENWERLWDDLLEIYNLPSPRNHFIGSVVTQQVSSPPEGPNLYTLIDGQQRMTTLFILLSVIRQLAESDTETWDKLAEEIYEDCLVNKFIEGDGKIKLMPTQRDRSVFASVVNGETPSDDSQIAKARIYFKRALGQGDSNGDKIDLRKLHNCIVNHLDMVSIHLGEDDSPNRIFESLNNTGLLLSVTDLIRNYLLMNISDLERQEQVYKKHWLPMEQLLISEEPEKNYDRSSEFFWRYLMMNGSLPREGDTYNEIRERLNSPKPEKIVETMKDFSKFSCYFAQIAELNTLDMDSTVLEQVQRLNQWEVNVSYSFLMKMFDGLSSEKINQEELISIMKKIESFVVRRTICGVPTNRLRRIFAQMSGQENFKDIIEFTQKHLSENQWPSDDEFHSAFVNYRLYIPARRNRTRLIMDTLEHSFEHKETPEFTPEITIEHIMPQELTPEWKNYLGENALDIHTEWLDTIGNLTLTGYNPTLSRRIFKKKKSLLAESNFALSASIQKVDKWDATAIENRGNELADQALQIWKR